MTAADGFRDEAVRIEVALDESGRAAYVGDMAASLYVERVGPASAPTVYYLHGGPGYNSVSFREIVGAELEGYDVIYPDQRGAGRSTGAGGSDPRLLARDVFAVLDALEVAEATLVAHGYGALVAASAARIDPERIARLVLVNPWISMPLLARDLHAEAIAAASADPATAGDADGADPRALVDEAFALVNPKVLFDAMQFPSASSRAFLEHVDAVALQGDTPDDVDDGVWLQDGVEELAAAAGAGVSVAVLSGRFDRTSYPSQAEAVLTVAPDAVFGLLDAGHYPWVDDEDFGATLREALGTADRR